MQSNLFTIIEDAQALDVTDGEAAYLLERGIVYQCDECGRVFLHVEPGREWSDVDAALCDARLSLTH